MNRWPLILQVMRAGTNQRPLTPGQGGQSQQESLAAAANPALAFTSMPGECECHYPPTPNTGPMPVWQVKLLM